MAPGHAFAKSGPEPLWVKSGQNGVTKDLQKVRQFVAGVKLRQQ
jgi:hypothetical protein